MGMREELEKMIKYERTLEKLIEERKKEALTIDFFGRGKNILAYLKDNKYIEGNKYIRGNLKIMLTKETDGIGTEKLSIFYRDALVYEGKSAGKNLDRKNLVDVTTYLPGFSWEEEFFEEAKKVDDEIVNCKIRERQELMFNFGITMEALEEEYKKDHPKLGKLK